MGFAVGKLLMGWGTGPGPDPLGRSKGVMGDVVGCIDHRHQQRKVSKKETYLFVNFVFENVDVFWSNPAQRVTRPCVCSYGTRPEGAVDEFQRVVAIHRCEEAVPESGFLLGLVEAWRAYILLFPFAATAQCSSMFPAYGTLDFEVTVISRTQLICEIGMPGLLIILLIGNTNRRTINIHDGYGKEHEQEHQDSAEGRRAGAADKPPEVQLRRRERVSRGSHRESHDVAGSHSCMKRH
jgi:hypothetical protein